MTINYIHKGGGCEALVRTEGNELFDMEVHIYECENPFTCVVNFGSGDQKLACEQHAKYWLEMWDDATLMPLDVTLVRRI